MGRSGLDNPENPAVSRSTQFLAGFRGIVPILFGVVPFGVIYGALARQAGIPLAASQAMSSIVFAGSSQFIAVKLIEQAVPGLVVVITIFVVNLRHALYSASVAGYTRHLPLRWKALLAYLLTDEAYAVAITRYNQAGVTKWGHFHFLGAGLTLWASWQASTAVGILLGAVIPDGWSLDFALPLTFIALLVPALRNRAGTAASLTGGIMALLAYSLPYKLGIIVAAGAGIVAGMLVEKRK